MKKNIPKARNADASQAPLSPSLWQLGGIMVVVVVVVVVAVCAS